MPASRHGARFKILLARGRADQFTHVAKLRELGALARDLAWCVTFENFFTCKKFSSFQKCALQQKCFAVCGRRRKNFLKKVPGPQKLLRIIA